MCACTKMAAVGSRGVFQAIGKSRGGPTTKIHAVVDALGNPIELALSEGQAHDITSAPGLLSDVHDASVLADMAYDSAELRKMLEANGNRSVIPSNPTRAVQYALDRHTYRERWLVEDFFRRLKRYRRIATRYEKRARMFFVFVLLASVLIWLA